MEMEQVRSFVAVELPEELRQELARLQSQLKSVSFPVKWVDPHSIHLTLKFLGGVPADRLPQVKAALAEAIKGIPPFRIEVKGLGVFPNPRRVRVVWVGLTGDLDQLLKLQKQVEASLVPLGFPPEEREFAAHLTLARVREEARPEERQKLGAVVASTSFESASAIEVDSISLMKSQLTPQGAIYTRLESFRLG